MSYKIHLLNRTEDNKVPDWNENKRKGYRMAECGYQRKYTTKELDDTTCKLCLREYFKEK